MNSTLQKLFKLAAACLVFAGLAACGGGGGNPPPADLTNTGITDTSTNTSTTPTGTTTTGGTPTTGTTTSGNTTTGTVTTGTTTVSTTTTGTFTGGPSATPTNPTPTAAPLTALQIATAYLASVDSSIATSLITTGAAVTSRYDGCYLNGGRTKANAISSYDADWAVDPATSAYRIGSTRVNPVVTADRNTTNPDGTARREIDVQYAINYKDGSVDNAANLTLITGSSFGSCPTAQNSPDVRNFGDRQLVAIEVRAEATRTNQLELLETYRALLPGATTVYLTRTFPNFTATYAIVPAGEPKVVPVVYERFAQFRIQDPLGNATYAVVTGPGFRTVSNVLTPFSLKMLSPRLLKSDPLLAGKRQLHEPN